MDFTKNYMKVKNYILLSKVLVNNELMISKLEKSFPDANWIFMSQKSDFNILSLKKINPDKIFIPHWSYIIPKEIVQSFECVVFHMTDLPYGRGGSPLQNLIVRGHEKTKISAIRIEEGVDTGDIYLKKELSLKGKASEIFEKSRNIVVEMISEIIDKNLVPFPQQGEVVEFKRRTPDMSNLMNVEELKEVYNYIRMLDADGYPKAFLETNKMKFEFTDVNFETETEITANVRITKK